MQISLSLVAVAGLGLTPILSLAKPVATPTPIGPARAISCTKIKTKKLTLTHRNSTQNVAFVDDYHVHNYVGNVPVPGIDNPLALTSTSATKPAKFQFDECSSDWIGTGNCEIFGGTSHCYGKLIDAKSGSCVTFDRVDAGSLYLVARECAERDDHSQSGQWWKLTSEGGVSTLELFFGDKDTSKRPKNISFYSGIKGKNSQAVGVTGGKVKEGAWTLTL